MTFQSWLIYLTLVFIATSTPGPAVFFIMTKSTLYGWEKASFSALGNITGLFCLGIIAVTGLGTILKTSEIIFNMVKFAGAAYLIYLGLVQFFTKNADNTVSKTPLTTRSVSSGKIFLQALGVAISNPKAIIFLTALFPQFLDVNKALAPQFAILVSVLMTSSFCFLMFYAIVAHKIKDWLIAPSRLNLFRKITGSVFISFGVLLATASKE
jgi:homoserine/homoserine lactone efflux protein